MKLIGMLIILSSIPSFCWSKPVVVTTKQSEYKELQTDHCTYDEVTKTVKCTNNGVYQKIIVRSDKDPKPEGTHFLGTIESTVAGKKNKLYMMDPHQAAAHHQQAALIIPKIAKLLFNPVDTTVTPAKSNPFAQTSLNSAAVDTLFGAAGLKCSSDLIGYIKNFYFYIEYIVRMEYAALMATYAQQQGIDMHTLVLQHSWKDFITALTNKTKGWKGLMDALRNPKLQPSWKSIAGLVKATSWKDLAQSDFWQAFAQLTPDDIVQSLFWQNYLKTTIARTFVQDETILSSIVQIEQSLFLYIPNIEIAYYHPDFAALRDSSEMFHISLLLTDAYRVRLLDQCQEWQQFKDGKTGRYDMRKVRAACQDFEKTSFYQVMNMGENLDPATTYRELSQNKFAVNTALFKDEPLMHDRLIAVSMLKVLHGLTQYLYDIDQVDATMAFLAKNKQQPTPSCLLYSAPDYLYVRDLAQVHANVQQAALTQQDPSKANSVQAPFMTVKQAAKNAPHRATVKVQGFFDDVGHAFSKFGYALKEGFEAMGDAFVKAGEALVESIEAGLLEVTGGIASIPGLGEFLTGISPSQAKKLLDSAKKLGTKAAEDLRKAGKAASKIVDDLEKAGQQAVDALKTAADEFAHKISQGIGDVCNTVLAGQDTELCHDVSGAFEIAFTTVIDEIAETAHQVIETAGGVVKLTADAVELIAETATDLVIGDFKHLGSDLVNGLKKLGMDAAIAILNTFTYSFKFLVEELMNALKFVQYFISILTRLFIDASTAVVFAGAELASLFDSDIDPFAVAQKSREVLSAHERVIGAAITTALLLATIPLTGGADSWMVVPMIAMTVGPQVFSVIGAEQEDELKKSELEEQQQFLKDYEKFVANSKIIYQQQQDAVNQELQAKYQAQLSNQERSVGFYQDFLNKNFESLKDQISLSLGSYWADIFKQDQFGLTFADVGSLYGIKTGVYELNPSQGFSLYNMGRASFSQEIAVAPERAIPSSDDQGTDIDAQVATKNWFNQKETVPLDKPAQSAHIRIKPVYILNSFSLGLYVGCQQINIPDIIKTGVAPLNVDQYAKMVVFKRDEKQNPVQCRVYEHEGKGWMPQAVQAPRFSLGTWYHMKVHITGQTLQVKVWQEPEQEPSSWQNYTVTGCPSLYTVGVIASGAAVEYTFVDPIVPIKPIESLRPAAGICPSLPCTSASDVNPLPYEKDREIQQKDHMQTLLHPQLGDVQTGYSTLQAYDKVQILKEQFIYTTQATHLTDIAQKTPLTDYVILCSLDDDGNVIPKTAGKEPREQDGMISLVTEKIYNNHAQDQYSYSSGIFKIYQQERGPLPQALVDAIKKTQTTYHQQVMQVQFGSLKLQGVGVDEFINHHNIYTMPLLGPYGKVLKDEKGKPLSDYLLFCVLDGTVPAGVPGISYNDVLADTHKQYGVVSLITYNLYGKNSAQPINKNISVEDIATYETNHPPLLGPALKAALTKSHTVYQQAVNMPQPQKLKPAGNQGANNQTTGGTSKPSGGGQGTSGTKQPDTKPADGSIQDKVDNGSNNGGDIDFGS